MPRLQTLACFCVCVAAFAQTPVPQNTVELTGAQSASVVRDSNSEVTQHDTTPTFTSGINLVLVPVVVRDAKGNPIGTLRREDFQLFDKSKPQFISKFSVERPAAPLIIPNAGIETDPEGNEKALPTTPQPIATRFVAWLFDDLHLSAGDLVQVRQAAVAQLAGLEKGARAGIFTTSGKITVEFTDDRDMLDQAMRRILPSPSHIQAGAECPDISFYQADLIINKNDPTALSTAITEYLTCNPPPPNTPNPQSLAEAFVRASAFGRLNTGDYDTRVAFDTVKNLIRRMALLPGSRTIVLLSPGFYITIDHRTEEGELIDRAIRANVVISALDARGVYVIVPGGDASTSPTSALSSTSTAKTQMQLDSAREESDVLGELSAATGGAFAHNTNDLAGALRQIAAQPDFIYILGFTPDNLKFDGSYHGLKVSLTKDAAKTAGSFQLQARRGYYVKTRATDAAEQAKQEIEEAFFSREEINDLPVELHTRFFKLEDFKARVSILARVDAKHLRYTKADGRNNNTLTIVGGIFDRNGNYMSGIQKTVEMKLKDHTLETMPESGITVKTNIDVASGSYVVRLVVRDSEGHSVSAQNSVVEIP
jgi:VWFA-related protein